jgi:hypothetical protein
MRPYLEKTHHKKQRANGVAQGEGTEFKPQYRKKKKIVKTSVERLLLWQALSKPFMGMSSFNHNSSTG